MFKKLCNFLFPPKRDELAELREVLLKSLQKLEEKNKEIQAFSISGLNYVCVHCGTVVKTSPPIGASNVYEKAATICADCQKDALG